MRNGQGGVPQGMTLAEFKPVPHDACGGVRRRPIHWQEIVQHRFKPELKVGIDKNAWLCTTCGAQVSADGKTVQLDDPDYIGPDELAALLG